LVEGLDQSRPTISVSKLEEQIRQAEGKGAQGGAKGVAGPPPRFDAKARGHLQRISDYLQKEGMSTADLHARLDANRDGRVDKKEFVGRMGELGPQLGLRPQDLGLLFDSMDVNGDGELSPGELGLYL